MNVFVKRGVFQVSYSFLVGFEMVSVCGVCRRRALEKISAAVLPISQFSGTNSGERLTIGRIKQMFGARKWNETQIAPCSGAGELYKRRIVKSGKLHSPIDCQRVDRVQRRAPLAASLRITGGFERLNFVQTRFCDE